MSKQPLQVKVFIGYYIDSEKPDLKLPTTKGIIHYSKKGAHIVPSHPDGY